MVYRYNDTFSNDYQLALWMAMDPISERQRLHPAGRRQRRPRRQYQRLSYEKHVNVDVDGCGCRDIAWYSMI